MTNYIDSLDVPDGVTLTAERDMICCQCGPQLLSFQSQNDPLKDAETIRDWWEKTGQHPLIIGPDGA